MTERQVTHSFPTPRTDREERQYGYMHTVSKDGIDYDCDMIPVDFARALLTMLAGSVNLARTVGPTLVHCQAGLNRSGLVTALALILDGMTPGEAIALLREKRCAAVLCNAAFDGFVRNFKARKKPIRAPKPAVT